MMFSMDEIIVEPWLMIPPIQVSSDTQTLPIDTVNLTIPYIPDWPELGATYSTPKISLIEALQNGANIALAGNPGSGKTVALAYLASQIARRAPQVGNLGNLIPIFIHAVDINFSQEIYRASIEAPASIEENNSNKTHKDSGDQSLVPVITQAISHRVSTLIQPRLPSYIQSTLNNNRTILLIDGLDELPPEQITNIRLFIQAFHNTYPKIQIIASVSFEDAAELPGLGFHLYALAIWGESEKTEFVHKWNKLWNKIPPTDDTNITESISSQYLVSWLTAQDLPCTPLEMTLKVWAAYSGDILGADNPSALEAYLRRMTDNQNKSRAALESLALQMVVNMNPALQPRHSDTLPISYDSDQIQNSDAGQSSGSVSDQSRVKLHPVSTDLVNTGLLELHSESRLRFINPVLTGYLAGKALIKFSGLTQIQEQPVWSSKSTTLYYLSYFGDTSMVVQHLLKNDDFLHREQLRIARWLKIASKNQPWRSIILRTLVTALNTEKDTLTLAARITAAIALSGDPGISVLFRQMLHSDNANLRQLAALACGITADVKAVDELSMLLKDKTPSIVRSASLALVAIGDKHALEVVADALLHGTELMRRSAAEALANHPLEGHPALQEGSSMQDLRVRHSVIYGLLRIKEPWARNILERMQMEDKEWLVRNSAIQVLEEISLPGANTPKPLLDLTETPWLVNYAAKQGLGVAPGNPAYELVVEALKKGSEEEKLHALNYLSFYGNSTSIPVIYSWYFGGKGDIRDAAYHTLWMLATSGVPLPDPEQYGFSN